MSLHLRPFVRHFSLLALITVAASLLAHAADSTNLKTISTSELNQLLAAKKSVPLLLHVGSHMFYIQAHIPGSEYVGAGNSAEGIERLRQRVAKLPKKTSIVLYCGCCPWSHCPTVNPAYEALTQLGFTNVRVLYMAENFGADWVNKGYPIAKGDQ